jgi:hypothetical protein
LTKQATASAEHLAIQHGDRWLSGMRRLRDKIYEARSA